MNPGAIVDRVQQWPVQQWQYDEQYDEHHFHSRASVSEAPAVPSLPDADVQAIQAAAAATVAYPTMVTAEYLLKKVMDMER